MKKHIWMRTVTCVISFLTVTTTFGQKKPIDHQVYDTWKSVGTFSMSDDGLFTSYMVREQEGDTYVEVLNNKTLQRNSIARAIQPNLTPNGHFLVANIKPFFQETRDARLKKVKADRMPKDTLGVYHCQTGELIKVPFLKSFKMGRKANDFLAYMSNEPADTTEGKRPVKKEKEQGEDLIVYHLQSGYKDTLSSVSDYQFTTTGDTLFFVRRPHTKDSTLTAGLFMYFPKTKETTAIYNIDLKQKVNLPTVSEDNQQLVFYAHLDTSKTGKDKVSILHYQSGNQQAKVLIDDNLTGLETGYRISNNRALQFSKSGERLFFGIAEVPVEKDSTIIASEVAKLDIWHYQEPLIQTVQLKRVGREEKKSYFSVFNLVNNNDWKRLAYPSYETVQLPEGLDSDWAYALSANAYQLESQWDANPQYDLYLINVQDGSSELLLEGQYISQVSTSPQGNYLIWYNNKEQQWYAYNPKTAQTVCMTKGINVSFANEMHDSPVLSSAYGQNGWATDDQAIYINDRYDIWQLDPSGQAAPINLTDGIGRKENLSFNIIQLGNGPLLPPSTPGVKRIPIAPKETIYFSVFDNNSKENGYYYKDMDKKNPQMTRWVVEPMTFSFLQRSKDDKVMTYSKYNFENSPDVWITKDNFKTQVKITDINPQQRDYNWGTAELVSWQSKIGQAVDGILYKPENFDPTKKYPMLVYFYERNSQHLYTYRPPAPSRSIINIPFFVSNEYLVFVPDIHYQIGFPGQSALDCIVPGVEKLIAENSWVDADNIGIQGQSWGGYQVAYMVTQPQVFKWKAAGAGAPVANMTSAYGGIRWGSGSVRQFQYEHTQSRLGKNLWDGFNLYIMNSPLFFADKVETPLLIMHNDQDEAVPWYQGIELFTALRRLGKPSWLLQYNGEAHNLRNRVNAKDLSVRLEQFFNHYLKGAAMPVWMKTGVPAIKKGVDWGFELTESE